MKMNRKAMVLACFAADSLALGAHWIYDTEQLHKTFGRVQAFLKPLPTSYHPRKDQGEFTHYGDQTLVLLESVAANNGFDLDDFARRWRQLFGNYSGYYDKATKTTLENFSAGKEGTASGSTSTDLAGAARIAPLVYCYHDQPGPLVQACRAQAQMTHNTPQVIDSAEFFALATARVLQGAAPIAAMQEIIHRRFAETPLLQWFDEGMGSTGADSGAIIARIGQSCHVKQAFPAVVHLIAKYETNLREALVECVMAGGDSAARGMIVGMVLGAHLGMESIPSEWLKELKKYGEITELLEGLDGSH